MPIWLEVLLIWMAIGAVLNITALTVFRKRGYFKWLSDVHDSLAYHTGYADAKKELSNVAPTYDYSGLTSKLLEHGVKDNRYK